MKLWKNNAMRILILAKRYFKKPLFLLTILAIPLLAFSLKNNTDKDESVMKIALYADNKGDNELAKKAIDKLCNQHESVIDFYFVDSQTSCMRDVQNGTAICGYIFPDNFEKHLKNYVAGKTSKLPYNKSAAVRCITIEDNNYVKLANELVISAVYKDFSEFVLDDFMNTDMNISYYGDKKELFDMRDSYKNLSVDFFSFYYADGSVNKVMNQRKQSYLLLPVKGLILTLILLAAMTGAILLYKDIEAGVFYAIVLSRRRFFAYIYVLLPTLFAGVSGIAGILISQGSERIALEVWSMLLYCFCVTGIIVTLQFVLRDIHRFASVIPIYILLNVLLCPVFFDVSGRFPLADYIRWCLPVHYGLRGIHFFGTRMGMLCIGIVALLIQCTFYKPKMKN